MMRSYFYFHISIALGFVNISEEIRTLVVKHCVFSSGRPKSNKMLNKNKIKYFGPYEN